MLIEARKTKNLIGSGSINQNIIITKKNKISTRSQFVVCFHGPEDFNELRFVSDVEQ